MNAPLGKRHACRAHCLKHGLNRSVQIDATARIQKHLGLKPQLAGIKRRIGDTIVRGEPDKCHLAEATLVEIPAKPRRRLVIVFEKSRIGIHLPPKSFADYEFCLVAFKPGMKLGPV